MTSANVAGVVDEAVSAMGGTVTAVIVSVSGNPIGAWTLDKGQEAKLGTLTYT